MIRKFLGMTTLCATLAMATQAQGQLLYSFEGSLEGWGPSGFSAGVTPPDINLSAIGVTDGASSLEAVHNAGPQFSWNASVVVDDAGDPARYAILSNAAANAATSTIDFDVTIDASNVPDDVTFYQIGFSFQSDAGFGQVFDVPVVGDGFTSGTFNISIPLTDFGAQTPVANSSFYRLTFSQNLDGDPRGAPSVYIDNIRVVPEPASLGLLALGALGTLSRRRQA